MQFYEYKRKAFHSLFWALLLLCSSNPARSAELWMIEEPGCVYCARFNREIGPAYPNTDEGKLAPLIRLQLADPWPDKLTSVSKTSVTPTFILVENGKEVDRLIGYPGDEHFWFLLGEMLKKL